MPTATSVPFRNPRDSTNALLLAFRRRWGQLGTVTFPKGRARVSALTSTSVTAAPPSYRRAAQTACTHALTADLHQVRRTSLRRPAWAACDSPSVRRRALTRAAELDARRVPDSNLLPL
ncbi:hypothetical protein AAFF_G00266420 [Aldrovandia affinis]|uniref:Uncharacterized protein n=1 Tax=Aldrovandia affinis TaxID=143900 RepID=A0AAD7RDZ9_9TELE|nr:hypothetical protein AAFF_G00266420 [Aldrovandia affinis]